ncbi:MAG: hypothetical protein Q9162_004385 [Coniocarpon cinnabarinum]
MLLISVTGFQIVIELPRVRQRGGPAFRHSYLGDVASVRDCFQNGLASPYDVDEFGLSCLHSACFRGHVDTVRHLLQSGADPTSQSSSYETPRDTALCLIFSGFTKANSWSPQNVEQLATLFDLTSWIQEQGFSRLHKIVLGLVPGPLKLEDLMHCSAAELEARDVQGRTPLWWCVSSGSVTDTAKLIGYGANAMASDNGGHTPVYLAITGNKHQHLRSLLDSPTREHWKWHRLPSGSNILHMVAMYADEETVDILLGIVPKTISAQERNVLGHTPRLVSGARSTWNEQARVKFEKLCTSR